MATALLEDDVPRYFAWLAAQPVSAPLELAQLHHQIAVELAAFRARLAQHESRVQDAALAASSVLSLLDDHDQFIVAADEVSARLAQLIDARPSFPRAALTPAVARIRACLARPAQPCSSEQLGPVRLLLKTSPPDEPMSAANWSWLRSVCPGF